MARILTAGAETGLLEELGAQLPSDLQIVTTSHRTGARAFYQPTTPGPGYQLTGGRRYLFPGGARSEIYGGYALTLLNLNNVGMGYPHIILTDALGNGIACIGVNGTTNLFYLARKVGADFWSHHVAETDVVLEVGKWSEMEFWYKPLNTGGRFVLRYQGTTVADFTGDTTGGSEEVGGIIIGQATTSNTDLRPYIWDDIKINDTTGTAQNSWPGYGGIIVLKPDGVGSSNQWIGSDADQVDTHLLVDDIPPNTTDDAYSETLTHKQSFTVENVPAPYNKVNLVQAVSYASLIDPATGGIKHYIRSGGVDYLDSTVKTLGSSWKLVKGDVHTVDPADLAEWTVTKVNALEVGAECN